MEEFPCSAKHCKTENENKSHSDSVRKMYAGLLKYFTNASLDEKCFKGTAEPLTEAAAKRHLPLHPTDIEILTAV